MRLTPTCVLLSVLFFSGLTPDASFTGVPSSCVTTPVGRWKTVDDVTGKVKSLVVIWEEHGNVFGMIEKIFDQSSTDPDPRCSHCQGELKNRPLIGLRILWDLKKDGTQWFGGRCSIQRAAEYTSAPLLWKTAERSSKFVVSSASLFWVGHNIGSAMSSNERPEFLTDQGLP